MRHQHFHFRQVIGQRPFIIALARVSFPSSAEVTALSVLNSQNQAGAFFIA